MTADEFDTYIAGLLTEERRQTGVPVPKADEPWVRALVQVGLPTTFSFRRAAEAGYKLAKLEAK